MISVDVNQQLQNNVPSYEDQSEHSYSLGDVDGMDGESDEEDVSAVPSFSRVYDGPSLRGRGWARGGGGARGGSRGGASWGAQGRGGRVPASAAPAPATAYSRGGIRPAYAGPQSSTSRYVPTADSGAAAPPSAPGGGYRQAATNAAPLDSWGRSRDLDDRKATGGPTYTRQREERERVSFKKGIEGLDARKKREENAVRIRKEKRIESFQKKRKSASEDDDEVGMELEEAAQAERRCAKRSSSRSKKEKEEVNLRKMEEMEKYAAEEASSGSAQKDMAKKIQEQKQKLEAKKAEEHEEALLRIEEPVKRKRQIQEQIDTSNFEQAKDLFGDLAMNSPAPAPVVVTARHSAMRGLDAFILLQGFNGSFSITPQFCQETGLTKESILSSLPTELSQIEEIPKETKESIWATCIAISFLSKRFAAEKEEWELIIDKSYKFIRRLLKDKSDQILTASNAVVR